MKKVIVVNKKEGETPLEALEKARVKNKIGKDVPMTYAGRLDPMASGVLLVLAGEECKNKEKYLKLGKEYSFEVLFGFSTDTFDILGKVTNTSKNRADREELITEVNKNLKYFKGKFEQAYPLYSSKTVKGKQLFTYGREGKKVRLPTQEINVKSLKFLKLRKITNRNLLSNIGTRVLRVNGDFRQKEILKIWQKNLIKKDKVFYIGSFIIKTGGGVYVRGIADSFGTKIGIPALAFSIKRTKVGKYAII